MFHQRTQSWSRGVSPWITPPNHSDLWITPKTALRSALSRSAVWLVGKVPRPAFVAPGRALTGLFAELEAFLARRIGVVQLLARDEEPAQRPPEAPDGTFRFWVVLSDVGFRLCHGTSSRLHRKQSGRGARRGESSRMLEESSGSLVHDKGYHRAVERSQGEYAPGGLRGGSQFSPSICTLRAASGTEITKSPSSIISRGTRSSGGCRAGVA